MRTLGLLVAVVLVGGCSADSSCWCDGEELDFSVVGDLAGVWAHDDRNTLRFDSNHRPRRWHAGSTTFVFGCDPGQYPLIVGSHTTSQIGLDVISLELLEARVEAGRLELRWGGDGPAVGLFVDVVEEGLVVSGNLANEDLYEPRGEAPAEDPSAGHSCG